MSVTPVYLAGLLPEDQRTPTVTLSTTHSQYDGHNADATCEGLTISTILHSPHHRDLLFRIRNAASELRHPSHGRFQANIG